MVDANIRYFTLFEKPFPQGCQLDFYVKASKKEECSTFLNTNLLIFAENTSSNMFSGNVYLYSEVYKENHWFYDVDGIPQLWNDN